MRMMRLVWSLWCWWHVTVIGGRAAAGDEVSICTCRKSDAGARGPGGGGECQHSPAVHYRHSTPTQTIPVCHLLTDSWHQPGSYQHVWILTSGRGHLTHLTHPPYANNTPALLHIAAIIQFFDNLYIYSSNKMYRRRVDNYKFTAIIKYINTASELLAKLHYRY